MNICKNKCAHDANKLIELLDTVKSLYERLIGDVCQYAEELEKFQDFYQRFNLNNETMFDVMNTKLNRLLTLFYIVVHNHLSITTSVKGIGDKIVKPVKQEYGTSTTLLYQNLCKSCDKCDTDIGGIKFSGFRENRLKVQSTISIATYDNISIEKMLDNGLFLGYLLTIGKLSYPIKNFLGLGTITQLVTTVTTVTSDPNTDTYEIQQNETLTTDSIKTLFEFVDNQIKTLGDVETILVTNIKYIDKYLKKFKSRQC